MLILIGLSGCLPDDSSGDGEEANASAQWSRALLAIAAFVILDACNSINESFQRSLFTDLAVDDAAARTVGHSILAGAIGFGGALGYLFAAVDLTSVVHETSTMMILFLGSAALFVPAQILFLTKSAALALQSGARDLAAKGEEEDGETLSLRCDTSYGALAIEVPTLHPLPEASDSGSTHVGLIDQATKENGDHSIPCQSVLTSSSSWIDVLRQSSLAFRLLCVQQLFAWLGLWPVWLFATAYFGGSVYRGVPDSMDGIYDAGVRAGSLACASMGLLNTIAAGLVLPAAARQHGGRAAYVALQAVGSVSVFTLYFVRERTLSTLLLAMAGFSWAVNNSVPFSAVRRVCDKEDIALHTNVLYLVQTVPQLLGALVFGPIVQVFGENYAASMAMSGACGLLATLFGVAWMPTDMPLAGDLKAF